MFLGGFLPSFFSSFCLMPAMYSGSMYHAAIFSPRSTNATKFSVVCFM